MSQKHIAFHKVLEALAGPGCPICKLARQSVRERLKWMLYESVNDPGIRRTLVRSRGFCADHGKLLLKMGHPLGVALIYRDILESVSAGMERRKRRRSEKQSYPCPACEWEKDAEHRYLSVLAEHFSDEEMHARILACRGFCIPHVEKLSGLLRQEQQRELTETVVSHLADLGSELSEIVRKSDYRCDEPWGREGDAWMRAVRKISGSEE